MNLPDETLWDETACSSAVCQHPQCWATIRRVERGHPRMLGSLPKTALEAEGLRRRRYLPDNGLLRSTARSPKVSVLNLDKTWLPCTQDARHMTVMWIPPKPEKARRSLAEKEPAETSKDRREKSRRAAEDSKSLLPDSSGTQPITQEVVVPPPSPAHLLDQLSSTSLLSLPHTDTLPLELIKDLLAEDRKTLLSAQMRLELAKMKKSGPLEKSRPTSALSSKMFLSVHHLTLQRPALRYPENLKKLCQARCSESAKSPETCKGPPEKAEARNPLAGDLPAPENHTQRQQQPLEIDGPALKQDAPEGPALEHPEHVLDFSPKDTSTRFIKAEADEEGIPAQEEAKPEPLASNQEKTTRDLSASTPKTSWNLELKLLKILQDTEEEDQENPPSPAQRRRLSEQDG